MTYEFLREKLRSPTIGFLAGCVALTAVIGTVGVLIGKTQADPWFPTSSFGNTGEWVGAVATTAAILAVGLELRRSKEADIESKRSELRRALDDWDPHGIDVQQQRNEIGNLLLEVDPADREIANWVRTTHHEHLGWQPHWLYGCSRPCPLDGLKADLRRTTDSADRKSARRRIAWFIHGYTIQKQRYPASQQIRGAIKAGERVQQSNRLLAAKTTLAFAQATLKNEDALASYEDRNSSQAARLAEAEAEVDAAQRVVDAACQTHLPAFKAEVVTAIESMDSDAQRYFNTKAFKKETELGSAIAFVVESLQELELRDPCPGFITQ